MSSSQADYIFEPFKFVEVAYQGSEVPRPRSGHRIACDDATMTIYCFGGFNPDPTLPVLAQDNASWTPARPLFRELWSFSLTTRRWKLHRVLENMPEELASNAMCMYKGHLMIYGGTGSPFGNKCNNDVITWKVGPGDARLQILDVKEPKPPGQYGQAVLCHNGEFYSVGGTNGFAYNCDIYRLDLRTLTWASVFVGTGQDEEPMGRYRHELAHDKNKIYIIGGGTGEWAFELMEMPVFDLETKTWTTLYPKPDDILDEKIAPQPRKCHSAVQIDTPNGVQVFVAGGADGGDTHYKDVWRLNLNTLQWNLMTKTELPTCLFFHSSTATSEGCMYVFGGIESKGRDSETSRNNKLYKVWLCIPKLSEICWEAVLQFCPNIYQLDRRTLLNLGIPIHMVDRIGP